MPNWQLELKVLHEKLDHMTALLLKIDEETTDLEYKHGWPEIPDEYFYVRDTRITGFRNIIMRAAKLHPESDEIVMRLGTASYHREQLEDFWEFAGPITQEPEE